MANMKYIEAKAARVEEIKAMIEKSQSVTFFDYRGITVEEDTALRAKMREAGAEYVVIKNSLVSRAAESLGVDKEIEHMLNGPSAFAFGYNDAVAPAKILKDTVKNIKKCEIKGGIIEGKLSTADEMNKLADLPSREQLLAKMLGSMMRPISGLAIVLDQIAKKSEPAAE